MNAIGKFISGAVAGIGNVLLLTEAGLSPEAGAGALASCGVAVGSFFASLGDLKGEQRLIHIDKLAGLPALIIEPENIQALSPVLLFLHGKGEAGSTANEIPMVCLHQTPPFQAMLGRLPGTAVIAPQAPPVPNKDDWNWVKHLRGIAEVLSSDRFAGRRLVATGFSRGGLGVLQLVSAFPNLISSWAAVDPQPARNDEEAQTILESPAISHRAWVRYGVYRTRNDGWQKFSSDLASKMPEENYGTTELSHSEMAFAAYGGSALSKGRKNLYESLSLEFTRE